jgi:hypothetical protein
MGGVRGGERIIRDLEAGSFSMAVSKKRHLNEIIKLFF